MKEYCRYMAFHKKLTALGFNVVTNTFEMVLNTRNTSIIDHNIESVTIKKIFDL